MLSLFSRNDLHSAVQPPVNAFGNQAMTTACLPLNWSSEYVLPSDPGNVKAGALSPTFKSAASAARADHISPNPSKPRMPQTERFIVTSSSCSCPRPTSPTPLGMGNKVGNGLKVAAAQVDCNRLVRGEPAR